MANAKDPPDFDDKKFWKPVFTASIHLNESSDQPKTLMSVLLAGGELKLPGDGNAKNKIGTVCKYQSLQNKHITGKAISYFGDQPIFKVWGGHDSARPSVAIKLHKQWVMHDLGGDILRTLLIKGGENGSVTHIYFEFYNPDKLPYAYIFLENPNNPLVKANK